MVWLYCRRGFFNLSRKHVIWKRSFKTGTVCHCNDRISWSPQVEMYVRKMVNRYDLLSEKMINDLDQSEIKKTSKALQQLAPVKELYHTLLSKRKELLELSSEMIDDEEFSKLVTEEIQDYRNQINDVQQDLVSMLSPKDTDDENSAILEVRAGTGGKEASLFAAEIFAMYQKFSSGQRWNFDVLSHSVGESEGIKDASASISGDNVFGSLKFEIGVHRVQRIPVTESQGRVHTSTITVAVLPQPSEIDITVNQSDLRIETFRSSGPGGQHVNKTDSAVRVIHIPSGLTVSCQEDRSQIKNKLQAITLLRTKLYDIERQKADKLRKETRKLQIGSGDRSERIRTYNFLQDRITDHRVGVSLHGVQEFLQGGEKLLSLIEELRTTEKVLAFNKLVNLAKNI
ncbi:peptide chain release factor 1-like [Rhopilema esculentum]|uniref:peptide chain release factor 1-like n=1 Tax=Rhopilema esculentum TaxID=499914 RepID=UPI0031D64889